MRSSALRVNDFEILLEVGRTLNLSHAAELLLYSPPYLHQRIKAIERALGVKLFVREGRGLALTEAGQALLSEAHLLVDGTHRMEELAREFRSEKGKTVVIGARVPTINVLPGLIAKLQKTDSELKIQLEVSEGFLSPLDVLRRVAAGTIDIGFVTENLVSSKDPAAQGVVYTQWREHNTYIVAAAESYDEFVREVEEDRRITLFAAAGSPNGQLMIDAWSNQGIRAELTAVGTTSPAATYDAIRHSALAGLGVALLPLPAIEHEVRSGALRIFPSPIAPTSYHIYLATRARPLAPIVERVMQFFESMKDDVPLYPTVAKIS